MRFYLYEEQDGGCDYTIGCGKRLRLLMAASMEQAIIIATATNPPPGEDLECDAMLVTSGERTLHRARILAVAGEYEIDLQVLACHRAGIRRQQETAQKEAAEKAELERLKQKYGG